MIIDIIAMIVENRIEGLMKKRDNAMDKKEYDRVWKINMKLDNNRNRLGSLTYWRLWA